METIKKDLEDLQMVEWFFFWGGGEEKERNTTWKCTEVLRGRSHERGARVPGLAKGPRWRTEVSRRQVCGFSRLHQALPKQGLVPYHSDVVRMSGWCPEDVRDVTRCPGDVTGKGELLHDRRPVEGRKARSFLKFYDEITQKSCQMIRSKW